MTHAFFLGSHPALSAAEVAAWAERTGVQVSWDLSRLPVALFGDGNFPAPGAIQSQLGGTTMIGALRATLDHWPTPEELTQHVPEILEPRQGKRLIGLSALPCPAPSPPPPTSVVGYVSNYGSWIRTADVRRLAMDLKKSLGMKGTRVVFPPARRPDLSTAQLLHNRLPRDGVAVFLLVRTPDPGLRTPDAVDLVTIDSIQDIESYARRDRGRPHADPGSGMLPPKVAQILLNLSLIRPGGTVYDPFCGVGTLPMEAALMGLHAVASDISPKQVTRTQENLSWLRRGAPLRAPAREGAEALPYNGHVFVYDITRGPPPLDPGSIDAVVTEGSLGPARTSPPLPLEAERLFADCAQLVAKLLSSTIAVLRPGGRVVITVPAFRVKKRIFRFPLDHLRVPGFKREPLVPKDWQHPLFREAHARGTLWYGRPDAIVLREIVRWRKK